MEFPAGKQTHMLDALCLLDGVEDVFYLCDEIGSNAAAGARFIDAPQPLVAEASDAYAALYGMTVQVSTCAARLPESVG
jgi:hypothetical protein